jgi:hypothetical protein
MKPRPYKKPPSEYNQTPLKEESLRKRPYSHIGHQKEFKDDMLLTPFFGTCQNDRSEQEEGYCIRR